MARRITSKELLADLYHSVLGYIIQGGEPPVTWGPMLAAARRLGRVRELRFYERVWHGGPRIGESEEDFAPERTA